MEMNLFGAKTLRDVSNYNVSATTPGGAQDKLILEKNGTLYLIKFNPKKQNGYEMPYHLSEHISCCISNQLGYPAQQTELVLYKDEICVLISLFDKPLITFNGLGSSTLEHEKLNYDLDFILDTIKESKFKELSNFIWNTFFIDSFVGNSDRHPNNWESFRERRDGAYIPAPLIDFGDSLFSLKADKLKSTTLAEDVITKWSPSAIKYKDKKYNFRQLLLEIEDLHFEGAKKVFKDNLKQLDLCFIDDLKSLDNRYIEYLSFVINMLNTQKEWYQEVL